ncbi:MAG: hypothetical protein IPL49_01035 [Saprospirales bacterium]|nr:hypothetical protein [Saprospirales bacterium]
MKTFVSVCIQLLSLTVLLFSVNTLSAQSAADEKVIRETADKIIALSKAGDVDGMMPFTAKMRPRSISMAW